jgi:tRNA (cytidine/uridine-2'-O-)-methyltransferase
MTDQRMKLVLVTPEIPHNTGAIGRTAVALGLELILIKPYGFSLDQGAVARSGTRYWKHVELSQYDSWHAFLKARAPARESLYFFEEHGAQSFYAPHYVSAAYLIFGRESKGLQPEILAGMEDRCFHMPMPSGLVKSLNLANAATAVAYQAIRAKLGS